MGDPYRLPLFAHPYKINESACQEENNFQMIFLNENAESELENENTGLNTRTHPSWQAGQLEGRQGG